MKNPDLISVPFAKDGQKNPIPNSYETSMPANQATWSGGFSQTTMIPKAAGGAPPQGRDFNGIFNAISQNIVYQSSGGRFKFDSEYAAAIGGYQKGAILQSDDGTKEYQSLIDNNAVNFNTATTEQLNNAWSVYSTNDIIKQINNKQPTGDYATTTELSKKLDKIQVLQSTGNSTADVMSQKSATDSFQPKGNYQASGDYATNTSLNNGLSKKWNTQSTIGSGDIVRASEITNLGTEQYTRTVSEFADFGRNMATALTLVPANCVITSAFSDDALVAAVRFRPILRA